VTSGPSNAGRPNGKSDAISEDKLFNLGKKVAAVFKYSLNQDGFVNFKKCEYYAPCWFIQAKLTTL
jgi:hypothetical protein